MTISPTALHRRHRVSILAGLGLVTFLITVPALGQETNAAIGLPGGASSLTETHGAWTVRCQLVTRNEARERICSLGQQQNNAQGQQVLMIELQPSGGGLTGVLVLPFGLDVTQPVRLGVDEGERVDAPFSTCMTAGCLVPIEAGSTTLAAMRSGAELRIATVTVENQPIELPVPLQGFAAAADRIETLTR